MDYYLILASCCSFLSIHLLHLYARGSTTVQGSGPQADEFFAGIFPPQLDVCDTEAFEAECPLNHVIFVRSALYGRMELGRCVEHAFGYVGCFRDVLILADRRCSGRAGCTIHVPNAEFESTRPCLKELKSFLRISYDCVRVENVTREKCEQNQWLILKIQKTNFPESSSGFIANIVMAEQSECTDKPWYIQAQAGQRINLTLYDFSLYNQHKPSNIQHQTTFNQSSNDSKSKQAGRKLIDIFESSRSCQEYAMIEDEGNKFSVCGGEGHRVAWGYLSVDHEVKIWITAGMAQNDMRRFIIQYEVVGCPDPFLTDRVWFRKTSNTQATSGCIDGSQSWMLECFEQVWRPQVEQYPVNCSAATQENLTKRFQDQVESTTYFSLTVTTICLILVALIFSLSCLIRHYRKLVAQEGKDEDITKSKDSNEQQQQHADHHHHVQSDTTINQQPFQSQDSTFNQHTPHQQHRQQHQHIQLLQTKHSTPPNYTRPQNLDRPLSGQKFLSDGISSVSFSVPNNHLTASVTPQFRLPNTSPSTFNRTRFKDDEDTGANFINETSFTNIRSCPKSTTLF